MVCPSVSVASETTKVRLASTWVLCLAIFVALALQGCWSSSQPEAESDSAKGSDLTIPPDAPPPQKVDTDQIKAGVAKVPGDGDSRAYSNPSGDLVGLEREKLKALPDPSRQTPSVVTPPGPEHDIAQEHAWVKEPTMNEIREEDKRRILGIGSDPTHEKPVDIENPVIETKSSATSKLAANSSALDAPSLELAPFTGADEAPAARDASRDSTESAESKKKVLGPAEAHAVHEDAAYHAKPEGMHPPHDPLLAVEHFTRGMHPPHDPLLAVEHVDTAPHPPHPVATAAHATEAELQDEDGPVEVLGPAEAHAVHEDAAYHAKPEGMHPPHDPLLAVEHVDTVPLPPHPEESNSLHKSPPQTGFGSRKMGRHADLELEK